MKDAKKRFNRSSGILMPIYSLPSPYGIGTLGQKAYEFVDFLKHSGQTYWQMLPMGHTGFGNSPYQTYSSVAGNPLFIDLDKLVDMKLLTNEDLADADMDLESFKSRVDYERVIPIKMSLLKQAFKNAKELEKPINIFVENNIDWLPDYALFMAIKEMYNGKPIWEWDDRELIKRNPEKMEFYSSKLKEDIQFHYFTQYLFFTQWAYLKDYANRNGIQIIGDIPIYPSPDSADVWANQKLFKVDEICRPNGIAGVPPDIYSETGQLWGNPTYDWNIHEKTNFEWWIWRIRNTLDLADVIRIDHFRAFQDYWEVPQGETTAINGKWLPGPGIKFFDVLKYTLGDIPIIAEDLGIITDEVRELLAETGYPGMRVMIFGLNENEDNIHLPHNWPVNCVGYTSTHDSETFAQAVCEKNFQNRIFAEDYINYTSTIDTSLGMCGVRTALASPASLVIIPIQDVLSIGQEGRMNVPSTIGGNWEWRLTESELSSSTITYKLFQITKTYKRI